MLSLNVIWKKEKNTFFVWITANQIGKKFCFQILEVYRHECLFQSLSLLLYGLMNQDWFLHFWVVREKNQSISWHETGNSDFSADKCLLKWPRSLSWVVCGRFHTAATGPSVIVETVRLIKPKLLTVWPFTGKVCWLLVCVILWIFSALEWQSDRKFSNFLWIYFVLLSTCKIQCIIVLAVASAFF